MPRRQSTGRHHLATPARDREHPTKALLLFAAFALTVVAAFLLGHQQGGDAAIAEPPVSRAPADLVEEPAQEPVEEPSEPTTPSEPTPADEPAAQEPPADEPAGEEPPAEEPVAEEPVAEAVTADEPAADQEPSEPQPTEPQSAEPQPQPVADPAPVAQAPAPAPRPVTPQPVFEVLADRSREPDQAEEPVEPVELHQEPEPTPDEPTPPNGTPEVYEAPEVYGTPYEPVEPTAPETYLVPLDRDLNPVPCQNFPTPILVGPDTDGPFAILPAGR